MKKECIQIKYNKILLKRNKYINRNKRKYTIRLYNLRNFTYTFEKIKKCMIYLNNVSRLKVLKKST